MIEFALLVIGSMVVNALSQNARTTRHAWRQAAEALGLTGPGEGLGVQLLIAGTLNGHGVNVSTFARAGNDQQRGTRFRITFGSRLPVDVRLSRESGLSGFGRLVGIEDTSVGDAAFDRAVLVTGKARTADIRRWLTPGRRLRVQRFVQGRHDARIEPTGLAWTISGTTTDPKRLVAEVRYGLDLADALLGEVAEQPLDRAAERLAHGDAGGAFTALHGDDARATFDALLMEGQVLHAAGRYEDAAAAFHRAERAARHLGKAERAEARDWAKAAAAARHGTIAQGTAGRGETPGVPEPAGPDLATLCRELFGGPDGHAVDVGERFEAAYRGQAVRWTGTLLSVEEAALDFVFGDRPLARAVFHAHSGDGSAMAFDAVRAVVRLPAGSASGLKGRIGKRLGFAGRLVACDTFARNLYVDDASLSKSLTA